MIPHAMPLWVKQAGLLVFLAGTGVAGILWTLRYGTFASPAWWLIFALYVNLWVICLVIAKGWQGGDNGARAGGFEVLFHDDDKKK